MVGTRVRPAAVLVGRDVERAAVATFLAGLPDGAGALVLSGRAGQGKTAVWEYAIGQAGDRTRVLTARPAEMATKIAYSGLAELFVADTGIDLLPDEQRSALRRAMGQDPPSGSPTDHATVAMAVANLLRDLATRPVVMAIDDLQWLDASSARALGFALRRLDGHPIGVLATRRGERPSDVLDIGLGRDRIVTLDLAALTEDETDRLLQLRLGAMLRRELVKHIHQTARGNPLYSLELARAALRDPRPLATAPLPVSSSLRELLGRRISGLTPATREVLVLVAAEPGLTEELVTRILGPEGRPATARAIDAGLLTIERGALRSSHPLLASIAYDAADPARRRRLHLLLAETADADEQRARHLSLATDLPDETIAAQVETGARVAHARGAPAAAAALAERALGLTPESDTTGRYRRAVAAADYLWDAGDGPRCTSVLDRLAAELAPGPERATVLRRRATATAMQHSWLAARRLLEQGIAEAGEDDVLRSALHRDLAFCIMQGADVRESSADATEALRLAGHADADPDALADARTVFALQAAISGDVGEGLLEELTRLAAGPESEDRWIPSGSRLVLVAAMLKWMDDFDTARPLLTRVCAVRRERQEDGLLIPALFQLAELECWAGRLIEAARLAEAAQDTERRSRREGARLMALYPAALTAARAGDVARARELAAECLELADRTGDGRHQMRAHAVLGSVALVAGDLPRALHHLGAAEDLQTAFGYGHPGVIRSAADHIETLVLAGDIAGAQTRLAVLQRQAVAASSPWATMTGLRCRGLLAAASGDLGDARVALAASLAAGAAVPDPVEEGRTLLATGSVLRRQRRRTEAREVLARAQATFDSVGAAGWSAVAAAELARLTNRTGTTKDGVLTPAEALIAGQVAAGRSNKEVAAEIHLSVKTVEAQLSSIYRKLGVRSRTELAHHWHQHLAPDNSRGITDAAPAPRS